MTDNVQRAIQAQNLLENEFFREVLNSIDAEYHARWRVAQTVEAREDLYRYVKVSEKLLSDLTSIATTGKFEESRRAELEARRKGIFSWTPK